MTTPWQLKHELIHVTEAELARTSRRAYQLTELRPSAGDRRLRRRIRAVLGAFSRARTIRPHPPKSESLSVADVAAEIM